MAAFLTAFGVGGVVGRYYDLSHPVASGIGVVCGVVMSGLVYQFAKMLYSQQASSEAADDRASSARSAEVSVAIPAGGVGQIADCRRRAHGAHRAIGRRRRDRARRGGRRSPAWGRFGHRRAGGSRGGRFQMNSFGVNFSAVRSPSRSCSAWSASSRRWRSSRATTSRCRPRRSRSSTAASTCSSTTRATSRRSASASSAAARRCACRCSSRSRISRSTSSRSRCKISSAPTRRKASP